MSTVGEFETLVLLAIARLDDDACGVNILRELHECAERDVSPGAIYTALGRLEAKGLVHLADPREGDGRAGRPRKYYQLTPSAAQTVLESYRQMAAMAEGQFARLQALASDG